MPYLHTYALTHIPSMLDRPPTTPTRFLFVLQGRFLKKKFNRTKRFVLFFFFFLQKLQSKNYITRDAIFFRPPSLYFTFFLTGDLSNEGIRSKPHKIPVYIYIYLQIFLLRHVVFFVQDKQKTKRL